MPLIDEYVDVVTNVLSRTPPHLDASPEYQHELQRAQHTHAILRHQLNQYLQQYSVYLSSLWQVCFASEHRLSKKTQCVARREWARNAQKYIRIVDADAMLRTASAVHHYILGLDALVARETNSDRCLDDAVDTVDNVVLFVIALVEVLSELDLRYIKHLLHGTALERVSTHVRSRMQQRIGTLASDSVHLDTLKKAVSQEWSTHIVGQLVEHVAEYNAVRLSEVPYLSHLLTAWANYL